MKIEVGALFNGIKKYICSINKLNFFNKTRKWIIKACVDLLLITSTFARA